MCVQREGCIARVTEEDPGTGVKDDWTHGRRGRVDYLWNRDLREKGHCNPRGVKRREPEQRGASVHRFKSLAGQRGFWLKFPND